MEGEPRPSTGKLMGGYAFVGRNLLVIDDVKVTGGCSCITFNTVHN